MTSRLEDSDTQGAAQTQIYSTYVLRSNRSFALYITRVQARILPEGSLLIFNVNEICMIPAPGLAV